jgi:hypothetical protein
MKQQLHLYPQLFLRERLMTNRHCITQGAHERVTVGDGMLLPIGPSLAYGSYPHCGSCRVTFRAVPSLGADPAHIFSLDFFHTGT